MRDDVIQQLSSYSILFTDTISEVNHSSRKDLLELPEPQLEAGLVEESEEEEQES